MILRGWQVAGLAVLMLGGPLGSLTLGQSADSGHSCSELVVGFPANQVGKVDPRSVAAFERYLMAVELMNLDRQRATLVPTTPNSSPQPANRASVQRRSNVSVSSQERRVLDLMNADRRQAGLAPLTLNPNLEQAARNYATTLARIDGGAQLSHTIDGTDPGTRARQAGYRWTAIGENIAYNYPDAQTAMTGWMNSPPHRKNILNPTFQQVGITAVPNSRGELYWSVDFGRQ